MTQKKETHAQSYCERSVAIARLSNRSAFTLAEGATHVDTCDNVRKSAFTLAEVLITLAIIGVVAAMTIPTLISSHKKQVIETKLARFYSTMQQATSLSKIDNGDFSTWDVITEESIKDENTGEIIEYKMNSVEWINKYFAPYMKVSALERPGKLRGYWFMLPDGSAFMPAPQAWNFCPNSNDLHLYYEEKDVQHTGSKFFTFIFDKESGVQPYFYNWNGTREDLLNNSSLGCARTGKGPGPYCTKLIQLNTWKIPYDYPVKF
ncbi:type II secretion system protein [bacterium]|nr:type II secretion system protein [bacterium]